MNRKFFFLLTAIFIYKIDLWNCSGQSGHQSRNYSNSGVGVWCGTTQKLRKTLAFRPSQITNFYKSNHNSFMRKPRALLFDLWSRYVVWYHAELKELPNFLLVPKYGRAVPWIWIQFSHRNQIAYYSWCRRGNRYSLYFPHIAVEVAYSPRYLCDNRVLISNALKKLLEFYPFHKLL